MTTGPMKLTMLGDFVRRHSVMTAPDYWTKLLKEVDRIADEDSDFAFMLTERAMGMLEMAYRYYQLTNTVAADPCGATTQTGEDAFAVCTRPRGHLNVFVSLSEDYHCEIRDGKVWAEWRDSSTRSADASDTATSESSTE